ncbi:glycoside hydrolase [Microbacterium phage Cassita]|nr:glycoside hydrolase [Microbacterium phage Cassita]
MPAFVWTGSGYRNLRTGQVITPGPVLPSGPNIVPYSSIATSGTLSQKVESAGAGKKVAFDQGTFQFSDFNDNTLTYGFRVLIANGVLGSGRSWTTFQMTPMSSTQAGRVPVSNPPTSNGQVNPLRLMRVGWEDNANPVEVGGFSLLGTNQGHLYNGLEIYRVKPGSTVHDILVKGIPGDLSREPGETFSLSFFRCEATSGNPVQVSNVEIDGRDSTNTLVAASGVGVNFGTNLQFTNVNSHHMKMAHAYALYETSNLTFTNCRATDTEINGFNFENVSGTVTMTQCVTTANKGYHLGIFTNTGGAVYNIIDPVFDGTKLRIRCTGYNGGSRTQDTADIHLFVDGVERPDLIQWTMS